MKSCLDIPPVHSLHMKLFIANLVLLCVVTHFQNCQALKRGDDNLSTRKFDENCRNCIDPEYTVLCRTILTKCHDILLNPNEKEQYYETINILQLTNFLYENSLHFRSKDNVVGQENNVGQCSSFREIVGANNQICEHITNSRAFYPFSRVQAVTSNFFDASSPSSDKNKLASDAYSAPNIGGNNIGVVAIRQNFHHREEQIKRTMTANTEIRDVTKAQHECGPKYREYERFLYFIPHLPKWKAKKVALNKAFLSKNIWEGCYNS